MVTTLALGTTSIVDAAKKPPSAKVQLKKAFRQLLKTRNYTVGTKVLGGLAKSAEHKVVEVHGQRDLRRYGLRFVQETDHAHPFH